MRFTLGLLIALGFGAEALASPGGVDEAREAELQAQYRAFNEALELMEAERHEEAGRAFLAWLERHPESENAPSALYNAGIALERADKLDEALELYGRFVRSYPSHPLSRDLLLLIGDRRTTREEVDEAIAAYQALLEHHPDAPSASMAAFNIGYLNHGRGRHLEAGRAFEDYARRFPGEDDVLEVLLLAAEAWEQASAPEAVRVYESLLRGDDRPELRLVARARLARLHLREGRPQQHRAQLDTLREQAERLAGQGLTLPPEVRQTAAEAAWLEIRDAFEALTATTSGLDAEALARRVEEVNAFRERVYHTAVAHPSAQHRMAFVVTSARALLHLAEVGQANPEAFDPLPYREQAIDELEHVLEAARLHQLANEHVEQARSLLHTLEPERFPAPRPEVDPDRGSQPAR